jgi:predicted permease
MVMCSDRPRTAYATPVIADVLLAVVVPVFSLIAVGALLARRFSIDVGPVTQLAIYAAVPALVFQTLASMTLAPDAIGRLLGAYAATMLAMAALGLVAGRTWPAAPRRAFVGTLLFGNAANMMLPISLFAFGEAGLERALVLYVATALSMFALGPVLVGEAVGMRRPSARSPRSRSCGRRWPAWRRAPSGRRCRSGSSGRWACWPMPRCRSSCSRSGSR